MTVPYLHHIESSGLGFYRILLEWTGSIYKGIWKAVLTYCCLYGLISLLYRFLLSRDEVAKEYFERACVYTRKFEHNLPLDFILGFYVTQVVSQWWSQYSCLAWPDTFAMNLAAYCPGNARARQVRRLCIRYVNLANMMAWRRVSSVVAKRFPTYDHFVVAGLMTKREMEKLEVLHNETEEGNRQISWAPILWAQTTVRRAFQEKLIPAPNLFDTLQKDLSEIAKLNTRLINFAWVNIPLVYTQLVEIAVHVYFFFTLFGKQFLLPTYYLADPSGHMAAVPWGTPGAVNRVGYDPTIADMVVPWFAILKFFFYFGWLYVSQVLINPLGEDDEDFDVNELVNRHLQISYLMVDGQESDTDLEPEDPYAGTIPACLPYTMESEKFRKKSMAKLVFPTDNLMERLTEEEMAPAPDQRSLGVAVRTVTMAQKWKNLARKGHSKGYGAIPDHS